MNTDLTYLRLIWLWETPSRRSYDLCKRLRDQGSTGAADKK